MGFLKSLGTFAGKAVGGVIGGGVYAVGKLVGSEFIQEVGEGAYAVTANTGRVIGSLADGTVGVVAGAVTKDSAKAKEGALEVLDTTWGCAVNITKGVANTAIRGVDTVGAICTQDYDRALKNGREFAKVAAIGMLSFGVLDGLDGALDGNIEILDNVTPFVYDNPPVYEVHNPYVAGGSYLRTMPDASITNNLSFHG